AANEAEQADLKQQIIKKQQEIERQRVVLGDVLRSMYVDGQMSTIEMLATSDTLDDYVDKEEYRNSVQSKIQDALTQIAALQRQLQVQKQKVDELLHTQRAQREELSTSKTRLASLLSYNQAQQAGFAAQISKNKKEISQLRRQQAIENARFFASAGGTLVRGSACGGTYPTRWCGRAQDSVLDSWGMLNRECVSYTAWKVAEAGAHMPYWGGRYGGGYLGGNASAWPHNARQDGFRVDSDPRGDVVVAIRGDKDAGYSGYGHAMFVESVNGDGTINISQYNANATGPNYDNDGRYSERYRMSPSGLVFIHFR
ncbi:MAG TPA: CHAP domain-containing protein, partial [Candidatus Saccharimonadales bacterium]|nr:CHAP domain-containing protein [Candidatus Saccharimonadales bacterium]